MNDGGLITLDIDQSVTDVGPVDAATGQRSPWRGMSHHELL